MGLYWWMEMTESQRLLAEYAQTGSDAAFRELVARYVSLVYSAAVRLVNGDAHRAQDVTQTVFVDLARKAGTLSREVMLGGWLHRQTCYVAANVMRGERRRLQRERQAAEMNALEDHSEANLNQVAPILDEAINQLGAQDRMAILLRYFEQRDLRSVGAALGGSENAAQKRVSRALEELRGLLKRRGVALSATALGTVLTAEAVTAAPSGLAAAVAATTLTSAAAGGGAASTFLKLMSMTKLKVGLAGTLVLGSVATSLVIEQQSQAKSRDFDAILQREATQFAQARVENQRLLNLSALSGQPGANSRDALEKLREEVAALREKANDFATTQAEDQRLRASLAQARANSTGLYTESPELRQEARDRILFCEQLALAVTDYADHHQKQFPTNTDELAGFLSSSETRARTNYSTGQFELLYQGSMADLEDWGGAVWVLMFRERQPWKTSTGEWAKVYTFLSGRSTVISTPDGNFDAWERPHLTSPEAWQK